MRPFRSEKARFFGSPPSPAPRRCCCPVSGRMNQCEAISEANISLREGQILRQPSFTCSAKMSLPCERKDDSARSNFQSLTLTSSATSCTCSASMSLPCRQEEARQVRLGYHNGAVPASLHSCRLHCAPLRADPGRCTLAESRHASLWTLPPGGSKPRRCTPCAALQLRLAA